MELYYTPGACSLAPHIVARELGLPIALQQVDLATRKTADGRDFTTVTGKGYVPALKLDNGEVLTETAAIIQYLADQAPTGGLAPAHGTMARYRFIEWLTFVSTELHKGFGLLWVKDTPEATKAAVVDRLNQRFADLDRHLATNAFLMGQDFTAADAYLFTILSWAAYVNVDLSAYSNVQAYQKRLSARPGVQAALRAEGLLKDAA